MKKHKKLPPRLLLLSTFAYDPLTGVLTKIKSGKQVGWLDDKRYRRIRFQNVVYCAHRVIYYMYHGKDPKDKIIDHCNGDTSDNRIANLRCVSQRINNMNTIACRDKEGVPVDIDCSVTHAKDYEEALKLATLDF